jgi:polysaccharide export outer membrane protein
MDLFSFSFRAMKFISLLLLVVTGFFLTGCSTPEVNPQSRYVFLDERPGVDRRGYSSTLQPGDTIVVTYSDTERPPPQQILTIPEGGAITLPFDVHVQAAGKSTFQLEKDIRDAYVPTIFVKLTATVKPERRAFYVDGEVKQPGRQEYIGEMTVLRAIGTAGGFTEFANRKKIQVRRGGQPFFVNWYKALDDLAKDPPVYPNDHIIVKRTISLW